MSVSTVAHSGCNRRILKAFYTQYVAVLLIVLVFTLGAFQRASHSGNPDAASKGEVQRTDSVGIMTLSNVFTEDGSIARNHPELKALGTVLREHDLKIAIAISVKTASSNKEEAGVPETLREIASLEEYFKAERIPSKAIRYLVYGETDGSESLKVYFEEADDDTVILR